MIRRGIGVCERARGGANMHSDNWSRPSMYRDEVNDSATDVSHR